jgi:hypothetical protein
MVAGLVWGSFSSYSTSDDGVGVSSSSATGRVRLGRGETARRRAARTRAHRVCKKGVDVAGKTHFI